MEKTNTIYQKLLKVQDEVGAIKKGETNPFFKSKYFDINGLLEVVKPVLSKNNLVLIQPLNARGLITKIIDSETGESIESNIELPTNPDPQKMGAIITYFRRYSLQSLLALQAEDDDGNSASGENAPKSNAYQTAKNVFDPDTQKIGMCDTCGAEAKISPKSGRAYCPNWKEHKSKGEKVSIVFPPEPLEGKMKDFEDSLNE